MTTNLKWDESQIEAVIDIKAQGTHLHPNNIVLKALTITKIRNNANGIEKDIAWCSFDRQERVKKIFWAAA